MMAGNELNMEGQKLADSVIVDIVDVVFVLVSAAEIRITVIRTIILRDCIFDGTGDIYKSA
jgi:hypothetical protein